MTAELPLVDEEGESNSPRTRGSLIVSVQWTHCDEEDDKVSNESKLWAISSGGGRALLAVKEKQRPELLEEAALEVEILRQQMEQLLELLLSMATEVLEPMYRLQNRMKIAQSRGKTAEEAKMLEQRLDGLFRTQLLPKLKLVKGSVARQVDTQFPVVLKTLFVPIEEYLSSFDQKSRRDLRSSMEKCLDELNAKMNALKVAPAEDLSPTDGMNMALDQYHQVKSWNDQLREILETFFSGDKAQWQFAREEKVNEMYTKLSGDGFHNAGRSSRSEVKTMARPVTAAAVLKRKERIEKAKQEKTWYEL
ncbi:NADP-dependent oxidoreductase domain-containing protein 1 [Phytophthora nicotianae]|nr:NADP-dependent oxidoreductase domain-containing protein 1 [Phytophthora nicotianae]